MPNQLRQQIEQISREKNINPDVIIAAIEDAILTASKKYYRNDEDLRSRFNDETGLIEVFAVRQVVEEVEENGARVMTVRVVYGTVKDTDREFLSQFVQDQQLWRGEVKG